MNSSPLARHYLKHHLGGALSTALSQVLTAVRTAAFLMCGATALAVAQTAPPSQSSRQIQVSLPNGYARMTAQDMQVQTTAGPVVWMRVWDGYEWKFNPQWESLSQSWSNLTGSQTADTTGSSAPIPHFATGVSGSRSVAAASSELADSGTPAPGPAPTFATMSSPSGDGGGCWVWVDDNWQPSQGTTMVEARTTPFNNSIGAAGGGGGGGFGYPTTETVSVDWATLCSGVIAGAPMQVMDGMRRINELYLGQDGRYSFNNRSVLEKRAVSELPRSAAGALYEALATGQFSMAPTVNQYGFRWQDKSGDWIEYDTQGQVVAWGGRNNTRVWLVRDSDGVLRGVVDAQGRVVYSLHYTGGLITEVRDYSAGGTDLAPRSVVYEYDAKNRLTRFTDVRGFVTQYEYDNGNHLTKIIDAEGREQTVTYKGNVVEQLTTADGAVTDYSFEYDAVNKQFLSKITRPETSAGRRVEDYTHNRSAKPVRQIVNGRTEMEVRYDTAARAEQRTNARGFATRIVRDEFENIVQVQHPDGATEKRQYSAVHLGLTETSDALGVLTRYVYDEAGNLRKKTDAVDTPAQQVTEYDVNSLGQITQLTRKGRTEANGTVTPDAIWRVTYDALGQIREVTDPENNVRRYEHDRTGNLVRYTDPLGHVTRYDLDAEGHLLASTNALNQTITYQYDKVGNLIQLSDERAKVMKATYDAMNRFTQLTTAVGGVYKLEYNGLGTPIGETDEDGRRSHAEFDNFVRLAQQTDGAGNRTEYRYSLSDGADGNTVSGLVDPVEIKYPTFTQKLRYDARERLTSQTLLNPNSLGVEGLVSSTDYDRRGQVKSETDANGKTTFYAYDALARLQSVTDSLGNKTSVLYDARGNLIQLTDAKGNVTRFEFDRNDRLVKEILPLGQISTYAYDAVGNPKEIVDANGHKLVAMYDAANRITEIKQYQAGTTLLRTTEYTWDGAGNLLTWADIDHGRNQTMSGVWSYDDANRKTAESVTYPDGATLSYAYSYSLAGYKKTLTWPDGTVIGYSYDSQGALENVSIPGEGSISVNQFKWFAPAKVTLPGGTTQERTLDGLLQLEKLNVKNPGRQTVLDVNNTYGKVQELKTRSRTDTANNVSSSKNSSFVYDDEIQLTQATVDSGGVFGNETETFTLDAVGNRIAHSEVSGAWTYDANNRLKQRGSGANATTYDYDDAGNLIRKTEPGAKVTQYGYDLLNRLIEVKNGAGQFIARYGYSPLDERLWKEQYRDRNGNALAQARRTLYLYADEGLIAEATQDITLNADNSITASGSPIITTQYGPRPNAQFTTGVLFIKTKNSNGTDTFAYFHHDQIETPLQATDKTGRVVWAASYNVFGQAQITTPAGTASAPIINASLRLSGQIEDEETGLHYNYRRYYDPATGRYITQDPIGLEGGLNLYRYAEGNPLNLTDATGECPWCVAFALCMGECMLVDAGLNLISGNCNQWGGMAKDCAIGCAAGMGVGWLLGKAWKWGRQLFKAGCNSFPGDTLVHVKPSGAHSEEAQAGQTELLPISQLRVGDEVLAYAEWKDAGAQQKRDERLSYEKITDIFTSHKQQTLVHITFVSGETLTATEGHPFKTTEGWRDAILLKKGGKLLLKGGDGDPDADQTSEIADIRIEQKVLPVFNIEVANAHTYFVGEAGQLVHNHFCPSKIDRNIFRKIREKYWKDKAVKNPADYAKKDLERMAKGRAPKGPDGHPMELHHVDGTPNGPLVEMSRTDHRLGDNYRKNHPWLFP